MLCPQIVSGLFDVFSSLWLIVDMVFDFLTTKDFYDGVKRVSKTSDPFDPHFFWKTEDPNNNLEPGFHPEAAFFYTSAGFLLFPIPVMMVITIAWVAHALTMRLHRICPYLVLLGPLTLVPAALASLTMPLIWLLSPLLHFVQALFVLLAGQPSNWSSDPRNSQGQMVGAHQLENDLFLKLNHLIKLTLTCSF